MSKYFDEKTKKLLIAFGAVIGGIILIIIIVSIIGKFKVASKGYEQIEDTLVEASKKYFSKNKDLLPQSDGETSEVMDSSLVQDGYMKEISKYQKNKNASCSGKVIVTKSKDYYDYSPYLECGDTYTTRYLADKLLDDLTESDDGLYAMDQYYDGRVSKFYVYRGEYPENYVSLSGKVWRVLKINPDNSITLILSNLDSKNFRASVNWDNRYNIESKNSSGINAYEKSRLHSWLDRIYNDDKYFSKATKAKMVSRKICLGNRDIYDKVNNGKIECSKMSDYKELIMVLPTYDFLNASLDTNCSKTIDASCSNYNYLTKFDKNWWFVTTGSKNSYTGYVASSTVLERKLSSTAGIRPVITLNDHTVLVSGKGTSSDPYVIK